MLFPRAEDAILASINEKNSLFFKMNDLLFGPGQAVSELVPVPVTAKNSSVLVRVNDGRPYTGQTRVFYDRLDFAQVFSHTPLNTYAKLRAFRPTTIHDLIPSLNDYYGLNITAADIEDGPLDLVNGAGQAVIVASPRSLGWKGQFTVTIAPGDARLDRWMTDTDLAGVAYPSGQSVKGQAEVYSYRYDCTPFAEALADIQVPVDGALVQQALLDMIVEITGDSWTFEAGPLSLQGALVRYNGANSSDRPSNSIYTNLIEIELGDACDNLAGTLRFHYNLNPNIGLNATVFAFGDNLSSQYCYSPQGYPADPNQSQDRVNPYLFMAELDYSPIASQIAGIPWQAAWTAAAAGNITKMVTAFTQVDGRPWSASIGAEYGLYGVYIPYNGPIANMPVSLLQGMTPEEVFRPGFTHVMLVRPSTPQQPNLWTGLGYVYYNP